MPVLARVYHVPPHMQPRLTLHEFRALERDYMESQGYEQVQTSLPTGG